MVVETQQEVIKGNHKCSQLKIEVRRTVGI